MIPQYLLPTGTFHSLKHRLYCINTFLFFLYMPLIETEIDATTNSTPITDKTIVMTPLLVFSSVGSILKKICKK